MNCQAYYLYLKSIPSIAEIFVKTCENLGEKIVSWHKLAGIAWFIMIRTIPCIHQTFFQPLYLGIIRIDYNCDVLGSTVVPSQCITWDGTYLGRWFLVPPRFGWGWGLHCQPRGEGKLTTRDAALINPQCPVSHFYRNPCV